MFSPKALLAAVAVARLASAQVVNPEDVDKATRGQQPVLSMCLQRYKTYGLTLTM